MGWSRERGKDGEKERERKDGGGQERERKRNENRVERREWSVSCRENDGAGRWWSGVEAEGLP